LAGYKRHVVHVLFLDCSWITRDSEESSVGVFMEKPDWTIDPGNVVHGN
jgi:hypothetical protein